MRVQGSSCFTSLSQDHQGDDAGSPHLNLQPGLPQVTPGTIRHAQQCSNFNETVMHQTAANRLLCRSVQGVGPNPAGRCSCYTLVYRTINTTFYFVERKQHPTMVNIPGMSTSSSTPSGDSRLPGTTGCARMGLTPRLTTTSRWETMEGPLKYVADFVVRLVVRLKFVGFHSCDFM